MAVATVTTEPVSKPLRKKPVRRRPLRKKPLPAGRPREWYVAHNRRLKAMRLTIALLDTGVYHPSGADNDTIRAIADRLVIHPPSDTTCRMVRALIRYGR